MFVRMDGALLDPVIIPGHQEEDCDSLFKGNGANFLSLDARP